MTSPAHYGGGGLFGSSFGGGGVGGLGSGGSSGGGMFKFSLDSPLTIRKAQVNVPIAPLLRAIIPFN